MVPVLLNSTKGLLLGSMEKPEECLGFTVNVGCGKTAGGCTGILRGDLSTLTMKAWGVVETRHFPGGSQSLLLIPSFPRAGVEGTLHCHHLAARQEED